MSTLNPALASLLYDAASAVLAERGVEGCSTDAATTLQHWAMQYFRENDTLDATDVNSNRDRAEQCVHFGQTLSDRPPETSFRCHHPRYEVTTRDRCQLCVDWTSAQRPDSPPLEAIVPPPVSRSGPRIQTWAVGITTSFRPIPTLDASLDSLIRAGWRYPRVFMDGEVPLAPRHRYLPVTVRQPKVRAWPNFYLSLIELLMREPHADAFLMIQDDALFCDYPDVRRYLEQALWPDGKVGAISLYCSSVDTQPLRGWHTFNGMWQWGAMAFVFSPESAKAFVSDPDVLAHRWCRLNDGCANIDTEVGLWSQRAGRKVFYPTPSLVQHIGDVSTLWPGARASGPRRADRYAGDV
jgi:hypothetical protein